MAEHPAAGWFPDPYGRAEQRFWDGSSWTSRTWADGGEGVDDPSGTIGGTAWTAAGPSTPARGATDLLRSGPAGPGLRAHLQRERPRGTIGEAVAAAAGVLGVYGLYATIADTTDTAPPVVMSIVILAIVYALALVGPTSARPAALAGGVLAPVVLVVVPLQGELEGRAAAIVPALLIGGLWAAAFVLPGLRGAPVLAAGVMLAVWLVLIALVSGSSDSRYASGVDDRSNAADQAFDALVFDPFGGIDVTVQDIGAVTLLYALGLLIAAAVLDAKGWRVLATPFLAVTILLSFVGLLLYFSGVESSVGEAFLVTVVGAAVAAVGALGRRRGSTWLGVALGASGVVTLVAEAVDEPVGGGVLLVLLAAVLLVAARPLDAAVQRRTEAGEHATTIPSEF